MRSDCSAASMAKSLRSRYEHGLPSIEISNCAPIAAAAVVIVSAAFVYDDGVARERRSSLARGDEPSGFFEFYGVSHARE